MASTREGTGVSSAISDDLSGRPPGRPFWPPDTDDVAKHGPLALSALSVASVGVFLLTLLKKESTHTPEVLRSVQSEEDIEGKWRMDEMAVRVPKLTSLTEIASKSLDEDPDDKCPVRFQELYEACVDVRALDYRHANLCKGYTVSARLLTNELKVAVKKTVEGTLASAKVGEDVADLSSKYSTLHAMCRSLSMDPEQSAVLWKTMRQLWLESIRSRLVLWKMRIPDVLKAISVILIGRRYIIWLALGSCLRIGGNACKALELLFRGETVETLRLKPYTMEATRQKIFSACCVGLAHTILRTLGDRVNTIGMMGLHHKLRTEMYCALLRQDLEWYRLGQSDQRDVHSIFTRIFELPSHASKFVESFLKTIEAAFAFANVVLLIRQRVKGYVAVVMLANLTERACQSLLSWLKNWIGDAVTRTMTKIELNWWEPVMPENITTVRACNAEKQILTNWNMYFKCEHEKHTVTETLQKATDVIGSIPASAAWSFGVHRAGIIVQKGLMNKIEDLAPIGNLADGVIHTIWGTLEMITNLTSSVPQLARSYELIFLKPDIGVEGGVVPTEKFARGTIEFENVSFKYPGASQVLRNVNFKIEAGQACGVTGSTGAGKTTLLALMQRWYDVAEGKILLDGKDIKELNPMWLRRQMAVVSQRPRIFNVSVLQNLTYGCDPDPSEQEVEDACRAARIHDLIYNSPSRFPLGIYTRVSNETLSGGELQRVAIARALLMQCPIIILDEATSALDSESQSLVKESLQNLMRGRTCITVAHRLETIKESDIIICVQEGEVVEQGSHQELVRADGLYSRLYREQIESTMSTSAPNGPQSPEQGQGEECRQQ